MYSSIKKEAKDVVLNYLIENNMSKQEFCKKCDIGKETLARILKGVRTIQRKTILKIHFSTGIPYESMQYFKFIIYCANLPVINLDLIKWLQ